MQKRILVRNQSNDGTFDKEYNELDGRLYFRESYVEDILKRGRCCASVHIETLMMVDSLDMS